MISVPFSRTLDSECCWMIVSSLMPWENLKATFSPQFSLTIGVLAKSVRLACSALFMKQWLGSTDEETVEQIRDNA